MNSFAKGLRAALLSTPAAMLMLASPVQAAPVVFDISTASLTAGAGYGTDSGSNGENGGTLLGVKFTSVFTTQHFTLSEAGKSFTFDLATVRFTEPDTGNGANRGIRNEERDQLDLVAGFSFSSPGMQSQTLVADVFAATGALNDDEVDYAIAWYPLDVASASGVRYRLSLGPLSFANSGDQHTLRATVELLPTPAQRVAAVPEPSSFALIGAAFAAMGFARRTRRAAPGGE